MSVSAGTETFSLLAVVMARFECLIFSRNLVAGGHKDVCVHRFGFYLEAQVNDRSRLHSWALRRASYRQRWTHHTV